MAAWLARLVAVLIGLAMGALVGVVGVGLYAAWSTLPPAQAKVRLADVLSAPVTVTEDARGIPTIRAETLPDALVALGWLHARDRLWQMEAMRRLGAGRMAEVLGAPLVGLDRSMRTLGLDRATRAQWDDALDADTRGAVSAYTTGVNAFIADPPGGLPVEFRLTLHAPDPWQPTDSLIWQRLMALRLSGNWREELLRLRLLERLDDDAAGAALLLQTEPGAPAPLTTATAPSPSPSPWPADRLDTLMAALPDAIAPTLASNAWAVAAGHSATGGALLASDPHLGFGLPALWYLVRLETPTLTLEGATVPGVPFVIIGHNTHVAWGLTTTHSDTADLYRERITQDGTAYLAPDGPAPFTTRTETIGVRFGEDRRITVRETRHGPVISDLGWDAVTAALDDPAARNEVLALASVALRAEDTTPVALARLNRATSLDEARAALDLWQAPQQNVILADRSGRIGLVSPGRVPVRAPGHDGLTPAEGWSGAMDWLGWIGRPALPATIDPPGGTVLNANNRIHPPGIAAPVARSFPEPYRAERLAERLSSLRRPITPGDMAAVQGDAVSPMAEALLPVLLPLAEAGTPLHAEGATALALLHAWTPSVMDADAPEPLLFSVWMAMLTERLFADDLGPAFEAWASRPRPLPILSVLRDHPAWCDDRRTGLEERCPLVVAGALDDALAWIGAQYGRPATAVPWGRAHRLRLRHGLFRFVPGVAWLTGTTVPTDGGPFTLDRGSHAGLHGRPPLAHVHGPGLRAVIDLALPGAGRYAMAGGQSGNPLSPHYTDQVAGWTAGVLSRIGDGPVTRRLTLVPGER